MAFNASLIPSPSAGEVAKILYKILQNESEDKNDDYNDGYDMEPEVPFSSLYIAWLCVAAIILIPGVLANTMIIVTLFKTEKLRIASNYLICSLATADLMMMAIMVSFVLSDLFQVDIPPFLWPSLDILVGSSSIINLAGVSFDRAIAVMRPLHYHNTITLKRTVLAIKCIWVYSLAIFTFAILREAIHSQIYHLIVLYIAYFFGFFIPCIVILVSYTLILLATIKNVKLSRSIEKAVYNAAKSLNDDVSSKSARTRKLRIQETKIALNFMVILLPFLAGWGFFFCTSFYELIVGDYVRSRLHEWFLLIVPWVSSSINPVVYLVSTASLRKSCIRLLCRGKSFSRAKESLMTTLHSKRNSAVERRASQTSDDKVPFLERINPLNFILKRSKPCLDIEAVAAKPIETKDERQQSIQNQPEKNESGKIPMGDIECPLIYHSAPAAFSLATAEDEELESRI